MRFERTLSVILTALIAVMAVTLVHREFSAAPEPEVPPPYYVPEWRQLLEMGAAPDSARAPIQIIEFVDLQCPACRSYHSILQSVVNRMRSRTSVHYIHLPLPYHRHAYAAARASQCAAQQGRLSEFLAVAFAQQESLGTKPWQAYGRAAGIMDLVRFTRCTADTTPVPEVDAGLAAADLFDVKATPTLFVNGWRFPAVPGEKTLTRFIRELAAGKQPERVLQAQGAVLPQRRTMNGVLTLQHAGTAFAMARQLTLEETPVAVVGGPSAADDLTHARSILLLPDGRIVTYSAVETKLLVFDSRGSHVSEPVRRGRGPREVAGAPNVVLGRDDTLLIPDMAEYRLHWVLPDRGVVRTVSLRGRVASSAMSLVGMLPEGQAVLTSAGYLRTTTPGRITRPPASVYLLPSESTARVIAEVPDLEVVTVETRYEGQHGLEPLAVGFSRSAHVAVWDTMIVTGSGDGYQFDLRNATGRLTARIAVDVRRRAVTAAMRRADVTERLRQLAEYRERPRDPRESQRLIRELRYADSLPPYSAIFASAGHMLWVVDAAAPGDTAWSATAFRTDGAIMGRLTAPRMGGPVAFGDDRVVLRRTDADGVVTLSVHRIVRAVRGGGDTMAEGRR